MLVRRGDLAELDASNPILASGEPAFAVDSTTLRIGNGVDSWQSLHSFITTNDLKKKVINKSIPSINSNESYILTCQVDNINEENKYAIFISPEEQLQEGLIIEYSFVSGENEISIKIRNISQIASNATSITLHIVAYLVMSTTTTTTTTTTSPPVANCVFSFGYNEFGQLGTNDNITKKEPQQISSKNIWKTLSAGYYHTLGIDINDDLYSFGYNYYGQLGLGNFGINTNKQEPTKVSNNYIENNLSTSEAKWKKVACGAYHSLAIDTDGHLFSFGSNAYGSLGLGDLSLRSNPVKIGTNNKFFLLPKNVPQQISIIDNIYTFSGIKNNYTGNAKYLMPSGSYIISGVSIDNPIAILNVGKTSLISYSGENFAGSSILNGTTSDGMYNFYYGNIYINVSGNYDKISIHTMSSGYVGGENIFYYSDPDAEWQDIAAGNYHSLGIKNGELYAFGHNTFGQLGTTDNTPKLLPTKIGNKNNWVKVCAGNYHSLAIDSSGVLWSFGSNNYGQLGLGDNINRNIPTKVSGVWQAFEDFNFANLSASGSVGFDDEKFVFNYFDNKQYNYQDRYLLSNGRYVISGVPSGYALAILNDGKQENISYSGTNYYGSKTITGTTNDGTYNFYYGTLTLSVSGDFEKVSTYTYNSGYMGGENIFYYNRQLNSWIDADAGIDYSIALDSNNNLWSFGKNNNGQLGLNDINPRKLPARLPLSKWESIDAGANHVLVVNSNKELWSFGNNDYGQLGLGDTLNRYEPTKINSEIRWSKPIAGGNHSLVTVFSYYPSAPVDIVVKSGSESSSAGTKELEVSWTLNTAEEEGITDYIIQYSTNSGSSWTSVTKPTSTNKSYVVKGLTNGTDYIFRIAGVNYFGQGAFSLSSTPKAPSEVIDNNFCDVLLLSHLDGNNNSTTFTDISKYKWIATKEGSAKISTDQNVFGGSSALFDGGAGLTFGSGVEFNLSDNFTIECFFRPISYSYENPQALLHGNKLLSINNAENGWGIYSDHGIISIKHKVDGGTVEILRSNIVLSLNNWHHIAWVRNGLINSLYINGSKRAADAIAVGSAPVYHDTVIDIGTRISTGSLDHRNIYGYIDEVRISKLARYNTSNYIIPNRSFGINSCE
ncbi:hypothetical protein EBZ38_04805 [bacterium]|nr:hypothetical protein [bacterium]